MLLIIFMYTVYSYSMCTVQVIVFANISRSCTCCCTVHAQNPELKPNYTEVFDTMNWNLEDCMYVHKKSPKIETMNICCWGWKVRHNGNVNNI